MAALVVEGIQRLGGCAGIEALPGLLPSLLDGVSGEHALHPFLRDPPPPFLQSMRILSILPGKDDS